MSFLHSINLFTTSLTGVQRQVQSRGTSEIEIYAPKTKNLGTGIEIESTTQKTQKPNVAKIPSELQKQIEEFENSFNIDFFVTQMAPKTEKLKDGTIRSSYLDSNGNILKQEIISPDRSSKSCTYFDENGNKRGAYNIKSIYDEETDKYYWMPPNFINYEKGIATN